MDDDPASPPVVGLGIDLCEVERLKKAVTRHPRLLERLFCEGERLYAESRANPWPHLAARFAAKEATMKALGVGIGGIAFKEVEVRREPSGRPLLTLHGKAARLAELLGVGEMACSLTHTDHLAQAVVVAQARTPRGRR